MTKEEMIVEFDRLGNFGERASWHPLNQTEQIVEVVLSNEKFAVICKHKDNQCAYFLAGIINGKYGIQPVRKGDLRIHNLIDVKKKWD